MESQELNDICRICLEQNATLHWDNKVLKTCGKTYKDCYYKYTQLEIPAFDPFSQMLCHRCSTDLRTSHILMVKALESHETLQANYAKRSLEIANEDLKRNSDSLTDLLNEPAKFELVIFKPLQDDSTDDDDNDDKCHATTNIETTNENLPEQRKRRVCKRPTWIDSGTFQINIPQSISTKTSPSAAQKQFCSKIKKEKRAKENIKNKASDTIITEASDRMQKSDEIGTSSSHKTVKIGRPRSNQTFMCSICSKLCKNKTVLESHENRHHYPQNRERSEICPHCGIKFFDRKILEMHMVTHDLNRKKHQCEHCEKAYFNISALNIHRRKHLGQMIPCPLCPKEFFRQVDLERHNIAAHSSASLHSNIKKMPKYNVYCKECNKHMRSTSWRAHQAAHLKEPLMRCALCDKDFFSRNTCTYHMDKTHNFKKRVDYEPFIIYLKGRLTHLMLEQQATIQPITT